MCPLCGRSPVRVTPLSSLHHPSSSAHVRAHVRIVLTLLVPRYPEVVALGAHVLSVIRLLTLLPSSLPSPPSERGWGESVRLEAM